MKSEIERRLCQRILDRRKELGMSRQVLADLLKINYETIRQWETQANVPRLYRIYDLAFALQTNIEWLLLGQQTTNTKYRVKSKG